jgi:hypothetical protein
MFNNLNVKRIQLVPGPVEPAPVQKLPRRAVTITGQSLAKKPRSKQALAELAAGWFIGTVKIKPSLENCARVFPVCRQMIRREIRKLQTETYAVPAIEAAWDSADWVARDAFTKSRGNQILRSMDRITS